MLIVNFMLLSWKLYFFLKKQNPIFRDSYNLEGT